MLFGHNTNVTVGEKLYHIQTEDRGVTRAVIDTTVYCAGQVVHRRTSNYFDLVPLNPAREEKLRDRLNGQHHTVLEELRGGVLDVSGSPRSTKPAATSKPSVKPAQSPVLQVELVNARDWLSGRRATLQIGVRDGASGAGISGARVSARIDGAAEPGEFSTATGTQGQARLAFDMPRLGGPDAALVIEARHGEARGQLRFQLRTKPKVPAAG
jgi:hypothetical protein